MARVSIYTRAIDAVFINIHLDDGSDSPQYGIQTKEKPPDSDIENNTLPINTNRQDVKPLIPKIEYTDHVDRKDKKPVIPQDSAHVKKQKHNQGKLEPEKENSESVTCPVCFLDFPTLARYNLHEKCYSKATSYECYKCNGLFAVRSGLKVHLKNDVCSTKYRASYKYACHFCARQHPDKRYLQSHLFHCHGDLIAAGISNVTKLPVAKKENLNGSSDTTTTLEKMLNNQSCTTPKSSRNSNTTLSKRPETPSRRLTNWITPTKRRNNSTISDTPSKRMKQTTLRDFIPLFNANENEKYVVRQKAISCPNTPVFGTPSTIRKSPTTSKVTESSTKDDAPDKKPFVHIHVNSNTMMSLLDKEIKKELDSSTIPYDTVYNLRSARRTSYCTRSYRDLSPPDLSDVPLEYRKKKKSLELYQLRKRIQLMDDKWKAKFNCKDCVVRLERCDEINGDVANGLYPSSGRSRSSSTDVPLIKFLEFGNSTSHKWMTTGEQTERAATDVKRKVFQCYFCKKTFGSQKDRREHTERVHVIYVSSICDARYSSMKKLLNHYLHQHMVLNLKKCCVCYEKFRSSQILRQHMILHCVKTTRSKKDTLPIDVETHCIVSNKQHKCEACRKRFWLSSCLKEHQKVCSLAKAQAIIQNSPSKSSNEEVVPEKEACKEEPREEECFVEKPCKEEPREEECFEEESREVESREVESLEVEPCKEEPCPVEACPEEPRPVESCKEEPREEQLHEEECFKEESCVEEFHIETPYEEEFHLDTPREEEYQEELLCTEEFREEIQRVSFEIIKVEQPGSLPEVTTSNNTVSAPPFSSAAANAKRLISGVARVKGYKDGMPNKTKFPCTICGKEFQTFQNLCMHEETYCKPAVNACSTCGTAFSTRKQLQVHTTATHSPLCREKYTFFCKFCNQGFNKAMAVRCHERHFHADHISKLLVAPEYRTDVSPSCNVCTLLFQSYERFIEHKMYYYEGQSFVCFICDKMFNGLFNLQHHYKLEHCGSNSRDACVFRCHICSEGFNYQSHFHAHKLHAHALDITVINHFHIMHDHNYAMMPNSIAPSEEPIEASLKVYPCNVCALKLLSQKDLEMHRLEYSVDGDFSCNKCERKCRTRYILAKHQSLTHVGWDVNSNLKCNLCNEVLTTYISMRCHMKHFHENNKNYVSKVYQNRLLNGEVDALENSRSVLACLTCGMKFHRKIDLKYHLLQYSDIGEFSCSMCQRKFVQSAMLDKHKAKHYMVNLSASGCPICNLGFVTPADLRRHVLHLHPYETFGINKIIGFRKIVPKIVNGIQGKSVLSSANSKTDTSAKCNVCTLEFVDKKGLVKHLSRFSNAGRHACIICGRRFQWLSTLDQHIRKHSTANKHFLRYKCANCGERFRSSVALYAHMIHIHGKKVNSIVAVDETGGESNDARVCNVQTEAATRVEAPSLNAVATGQDIHTIDIIEDITDVSEAAANLDSFCYTCLLCNTKHLTLQNFYEHFNSKHTAGGDCPLLNLSESNSRNTKYCSICDLVLGNEESIDDHVVRVHQADYSLPSRQTTSTEVNGQLKKKECDMMIIYEKTSEPVNYVIINENMASFNVQAANKNPVAVDKQNNGSLQETATVANSSVGKLKVKEFARIQSD